MASLQDPVLACRVRAHDAALSYDATRAGKNRVLHWCYSVTDYSTVMEFQDQGYKIKKILA